MRGELNFGKEIRHRRNLEWLPGVLMWILQIVIVCVLAFVFVWYFGQRVSVIGDSMNPVLENGDIVLVNRLKYDASAPKRGDIIVFRPGGNKELHVSVKRIVGLPGETLQIKEGVIYIDGGELVEEYQVTSMIDAGLAETEIVLAGDEYFVLGDHRESSKDSRDAEIGNVKRSEVEGKAWFVISPASHIGFIE